PVRRRFPRILMVAYTQPTKVKIDRSLQRKGGPSWVYVDRGSDREPGRRPYTKKTSERCRKSLLLTALHIEHGTRHPPRDREARGRVPRPPTSSREGDRSSCPLIICTSFWAWTSATTPRSSTRDRPSTTVCRPTPTCSSPRTPPCRCSSPSCRPSTRPSRRR